MCRQGRRIFGLGLACWLLCCAAAGASVAPRLQLIAEPQAGIGPLLSLISKARSSIELTIYELTDPAVERALGAAASRGVQVRVLLNGGYYRQRESTNEAAFSYLTAHRVSVRFAPTYFALTHQKTLTVDGDLSAIMTLNFDGLYRTTRDFAILDRNREDVRAIVDAFDDDWAARRDIPSRGAGDLIWSPGAEGAIMKLIASARHTLDLENEEMDYTPATDAICAAARRGVRVRIVMTYDSEWSASLAALERCGASVHLFHGQAYYIHAKLLIADRRIGFVGSQNLSTTSLLYNRELGIELGAGAVLNQLDRDFASDYTRAG